MEFISLTFIIPQIKSDKNNPGTISTNIIYSKMLSFCLHLKEIQEIFVIMKYYCNYATVHFLKKQPFKRIEYSL